MSTGAGRYAPSPSGELHLGNLRTALVAWLAARASGRKFLMRIEDIDRDRDAGVAELQLQSLRDIGIEWDEPVVVQSKRRARHEQVITELRTRGLVYECTCSRKDILAAPTAPHSPPGSYPGTCRDRTPTERAEAAKRILPRKPALRLRTEQPGLEVSFTDACKGEVRGHVDDFVLQRGDGTIAYNLAVVVDDEDAGIDQVVRGDDLALSTPRHIYLQRLLDFNVPEYAHVPLVLGPTGKRLAKRDGAVTLGELRGQGYDIETVRAELLHSLGLIDRADEALLQKLTPDELIARFALTQIPKEPWTVPWLSRG